MFTWFHDLKFLFAKKCFMKLASERVQISTELNLERRGKNALLADGEAFHLRSALSGVCGVSAGGMESTSNAHIWRSGGGVLNAVGNASALRANGARALLLFLGGNILRFLIQGANLCASTAPRVYIYIIRRTGLHLMHIIFYHAACSNQLEIYVLLWLELTFLYPCYAHSALTQGVDN